MIASMMVVEKMWSARDEIIIALGISLRGSGMQFWGWRAMGIFTDRRQKG